MALKLDDVKTLRAFKSGAEQVYHLRDPQAYRTLCERLLAAGFDFPQCLSGVDMEYGLRSVLHLRRLADHAEVTVWFDMSYDEPVCPTVCDLWGGVEWHEREAFDLLGIRYQGHPDLRRILLEDHWTIHPLQRRYDTGGYLIPDWQPKEVPDWEAIDRAQAEAEAEAARKEAEVTAGAGPELTAIRSVSTAFAEKLRAQGIATVQALADLDDEGAEALAAKLGLRSAAAVKKWRDGARELLAAEREEASAEGLELTAIRALNPTFAEKLRAQGIKTVEALAALPDDQLDDLAAKLGLRSAAAVKKWRDGARQLLEEGA